METIEKNTCQKIGYFQKPHGIKGALSLIFEPQYDISLEEEPILMVEIDGLLVPYFFSEEGIRFKTAESALVHLDWVEDEEQARKLSGHSVYIKNDDVIIPEEELTVHHLIGFMLHDPKIGAVGLIERVEDYGGNLLFQVQYQKKEVLVPFNDDLLLDLDETNRTITIQCPEGIFDLE